VTLAIDVSNYTSALTPQAIDGLKGAGIELVIVQAIDPPRGYPAGKTRDQVQACLDAGLIVDAYVWLWFDLDVDDIRRKLELLDRLPIRQIWLDVEDTAAIKYDQAACEAKVAAALEVCDAHPTTIGERTGIYSGRWYWTDRRYLSNTATFADRELWDADYDGIAEAAASFEPYGGWTSRRIKQYRGTSVLAGVSGIDLNVLSVDETGELQPSVESAPADSSSAETPSDLQRETPDDYPHPTWRDSAIAYRGALDGVVPKLQEAEAKITTALAALGGVPA
jgi:Glycosyl hydrolases family 25